MSPRAGITSPPATGLATLAVLAALAAGCASDPPTRRVETHLSRRARILIAYGPEGAYEEYVHFEGSVRVRAGTYTLAAVRLAEERKR